LDRDKSENSFAQAASAQDLHRNFNKNLKMSDFISFHVRIVTISETGGFFPSGNSPAGFPADSADEVEHPL
jgi:hypothetical protein